MKRVLMSTHQRERFFASIHGRIRKWSIVANLCHVSERAIRDWVRGAHHPPESAIKTLARIIGVKKPVPCTVFDDIMMKRAAARRGALARMKKYGNPGTMDGRRRGGIRAIKILKEKSGHNFQLLKDVRLPDQSFRLAEFVGILLGDGGMSNRQINITLNKKDDVDFIEYTQKLIRELFNVNPTIGEYDMVKVLVISRTKLVHFFQQMHLVIGSKVRQQVDIPQWIKENEIFTKACLRGLFDTDGCFYLDRHRYKNKLYIHCAMNFTNRSLPILTFFKKSLKRFHLHPTQKTKFSIFLRQEQDILQYFRNIGSSNPKHLNKFRKFFLEKYGEVPKWS